jgi:hypothetical protein
LDFLGAWPFGFENPHVCVLDFLGFPWILSSESNLFNELRGIKRGNFFLALFLMRWALRALTKQSRPCGAQDVHGATLADFLIFCNKELTPPVPFALNPNRLLEAKPTRLLGAEPLDPRG